MRCLLIAVTLTCFSLSAADEDVFRVYTEHPRLFLRPQRLRMLRKEPARQSMRWEQMSTLLKGGVQPPEPGFAWALFYAITDDSSAGHKAIDWALSPQRRAGDLRQLAIVYDWCQNMLSPQQSGALASRIHGFLAEKEKARTLASERDRILAAISIAERDLDFTETILEDAVIVWWRKDFAPGLGAGHRLILGGDLYPLVEILHAVRDNLQIDLRESNIEYFKDLAEYHLESHYPPPYPAAENEYRIPVSFTSGEPNLEGAALSRAAGLALVAYDPNATPGQFLQGWLIQDRFLLRGPFGAPYEFLWANPYLPGLAYVHLPLVFHDRNSGTLLARSSWEEDAVWFGLIGGQMQLFENGTVTVIRGKSGASGGSIDLGSALILQGQGSMHFAVENETIFVVGLKPETAYDAEADDEEIREVRTDPAGILELKFPKERKTRMWLHAIMTPPLLVKSQETQHESR